MATEKGNNNVEHLNQMTEEQRQVLLNESRKEGLRRFGRAAGTLALQIGTAAIMGVTAGLVLKYTNKQDGNTDQLAA